MTKLPAQRKKKIKIGEVGSEVDIPDTGADCVLILKIGPDSEFVEVNGRIKPACIPSTHNFI